MRGGTIIGHVLREISSSICSPFLRRGGSITSHVTGGRCYLGDSVLFNHLVCFFFTSGLITADSCPHGLERLLAGLKYLYKAFLLRVRICRARVKCWIQRSHMLKLTKVSNVKKLFIKNIQKITPYKFFMLFHMLSSLRALSKLLFVKSKYVICILKAH